jgi:hypothetical protein
LKNKILLIYSYLIPFIGGILFSILPSLLPFISYLSICEIYKNNFPLLISILAMMIALTYPYQIKIIDEDNPDVLIVLDKSNIRVVFQRSSRFQALFLLICVLILFIMISSTPQLIIGYFEVLLTSIMIFEVIAMISNGCEYQRLRQKIIVETHKAKILGGNDNKYPPSPNVDEYL